MEKLFQFLLIRIKCWYKGHNYKQVMDNWFLCENCGKIKIDKHFLE